MTASERERTKILKALWRSFAIPDLSKILWEVDQVDESERFEVYRRKLLEAHGVDDIDKIDLTNAPSFESQVAAFAKWADSRPQKPPVKISYI